MINVWKHATATSSRCGKGQATGLGVAEAGSSVCFGDFCNKSNENGDAVVAATSLARLGNVVRISKTDVAKEPHRGTRIDTNPTGGHKA